ncbi:MAG: MarR family transcriptional regulator [Sphaerochaetaceae bacterium]|jgi:DNA-binding MarR family transcriptional regulator
MQPTYSIGFAINHFSRRLRRFSNAVLQENHINTMQARIIGYLACHTEPVYQKDLETIFDFRRSSVTGILQTMEKNQLIIRISEDEDKRLKRIYMTEKGTQLANTCHSIFERMDILLDSSLSEQEAKTLEITLGKLTTQLENMHVKNFAQ